MQRGPVRLDGRHEPRREAEPAWVLALREQIGIPHTLAEIGVHEEDAARMAPMAEIDPSSATNPIPLDVPVLTQLYQDAIGGRLAA